MNVKTVAIFSAQYPPHMGGVENFTRNIAIKLVSIGYKVLVVTNDTEKLGVGYCCDDEVEVLRLPCWSLFSGRFPLPCFGFARYKFLKSLRSKNIDGVLINTRFYPHSLLGMKLARYFGLTPVVLDHGSDWISFSNVFLDAFLHIYEYSITKYGMWRFNPAYYGISRKSSAWLNNFGIQCRGEICNSIDARVYTDCASDDDFRRSYNIDKTAFLVSFVGRLIPEKGISQILEASHDQKLMNSNVVFAIAGEGPLADDVVAAESESLRYLGRIEKSQVAALLLQSDALCLPSRSEGFATILLEASACGCPSIVTDVGGARELIPDDSYGQIIDSNDSDSIVQAISNLMDNPRLHSLEAENCKKLVENSFSWDDTVCSLISALSLG